MVVRDTRLVVVAVLAQVPITLLIHSLIREFTVPYILFSLLVIAGVYAYLKGQS